LSLAYADYFARKTKFGEDKKAKIYGELTLNKLIESLAD
jgi:hypothetical protein